MQHGEDPPVVVEVDDQHRAHLGALAAETPARYLAHTETDGTIVLVPATLETGLEKAFRSNAALVARIEDNRKHPERLVRRPSAADE